MRFYDEERYDIYLDILEGYIEAFFFVNAENEEFYGKTASNFDSQTINVIIHSISNFYRFAEATNISLEKLDASLNQIGNDLFFSSNRSGVGFFDRKELYKEATDDLELLAQKIRSYDFFVNRRGEIEADGAI